MKYLIKFDESGRRRETYVIEEKTNEEIQFLVNDGFILVDENNYQLLLGNVDGKEHIRNPHNGEYEEYVPPYPIAEETSAQKLEMAKADRADAVSKITVEVNGLIFDGDETSQDRMSRTISAAMALGVDTATEKRTWILADNTIAEVTISQLAEALRLAGDAQTALWTIPYTINK